jgi:hypothetical protein
LGRVVLLPVSSIKFTWEERRREEERREERKREAENDGHILEGTLGVACQEGNLDVACLGNLGVAVLRARGRKKEGEENLVDIPHSLTLSLPLPLSLSPSLPLSLSPSLPPSLPLSLFLLSLPPPHPQRTGGIPRPNCGWNPPGGPKLPGGGPPGGNPPGGNPPGGNPPGGNPPIIIAPIMFIKCGGGGPPSFI